MAGTYLVRLYFMDEWTGDGMDDDWELAAFGNLTQDGTGDADGDGLSDLDEFLGGTDPLVAEPDGHDGDDGAAQTSCAAAKPPRPAGRFGGLTPVALAVLALTSLLRRPRLRNP